MKSLKSLLVLTCLSFGSVMLMGADDGCDPAACEGEEVCVDPETGDGDGETGDGDGDTEGDGDGDGDTSGDGDGDGDTSGDGDGDGDTTGDGDGDGDVNLCAAVDCAPGYHCEVQDYCSGLVPDCDPDFDPDCGGWGECEEEAYCVPDEVECLEDIDCPEGWICSNGGGNDPGAFPCYDEDGDGECDNFPPVEPEGVCIQDPYSGSCEGACGGGALAGGCFCDEVCTEYGDCCDDFLEFCEEIAPTPCSEDIECEDGEFCDGGWCAIKPEPDPCNDFGPEVCEEIAGCMLVDDCPWCFEEPPGGDGEPDGGSGADPVPPPPEQVCVSEPEPEPGSCEVDADCGEGGECITEEWCDDWCDQTVPEPECCESYSYCAGGSVGGGGSGGSGGGEVPPNP